MEDFFLLNWRELVILPQKTFAIPMVSPFGCCHDPCSGRPNLYSEWVRVLQGKRSGVYWYGWQPNDDSEPLFYIGRSVGNLYTTFVRHFSGVYSPVNGKVVPRSIVPPDRHHTVLAGIILTSQLAAPVLESRMVALWSKVASLENSNVHDLYDFSGIDLSNIGVNEMYAAKRYLRYLELLHGVSARRSKSYRQVFTRIQELEFVPF